MKGRPRCQECWLACRTSGSSRRVFGMRRSLLWTYFGTCGSNPNRVRTRPGDPAPDEGSFVERHLGGGGGDQHHPGSATMRFSSRRPAARHLNTSPSPTCPPTAGTVSWHWGSFADDGQRSTAWKRALMRVAVPDTKLHTQAANPLFFYTIDAPCPSRCVTKRVSFQAWHVFFLPPNGHLQLFGSDGVLATPTPVSSWLLGCM